MTNKDLENRVIQDLEELNELTDNIIRKKNNYFDEILKLEQVRKETEKVLLEDRRRNSNLANKYQEMLIIERAMTIKARPDPTGGNRVKLPLSLDTYKEMAKQELGIEETEYHNGPKIGIKEIEALKNTLSWMKGKLPEKNGWMTEAIEVFSRLIKETEEE